MSTHSQKARRSRPAALPKHEEYFSESSDEVQPPHDQEYVELKELCQKEARNLKFNLKIEEAKPIKEQQQKPKKGFTKVKLEAKSKESKESNSDKDSSQYHPGSYAVSEQDDEESYQPQEKLDSECLKHLNFLIRKFEADLSSPDSKGKKIKEISECMQLSQDQVKARVNEYFRKKKIVRFDQKIEQQTIYKKTEMFDDAIRRVLRTTPYACINDLREEIRQKLDLDLAKETLIRRLKNLKYHYKKFTIEKPQKADPSIIELRKSYMRIYRQILKNEVPILYYGTVHMALDQCRGSMWMKSKENGEVDHILSEKDVVTITLILSTERIEFYHIYHGFYKKTMFQDSINLWLSEWPSNDDTTLSRQPKKAVSVNVPAYLMIEGNLIHHSEGVLPSQISSLLLANKIVALPFPSYSSSMNPAQVLFNQIKYVTRGKVKHNNINELQECLQSVMLNHIDLQDIRFAFRKVQEINKKY